MAYALNLPLTAVDTLEVIAYNLPVAGVRLTPVLDAQKGNLYVGSYVWDRDHLVETEPVQIVPGKELAARLQPGDLVLVTADHGCDPTWKGTDHTREHVPMLFFGPGVRPGALQPMDTYGDGGQILARHLGLELTRGKAQEVY